MLFVVFSGMIKCMELNTNTGIFLLLSLRKQTHTIDRKHSHDIKKNEILKLAFIYSFDCRYMVELNP
jgi:hypothetical protein